ncbi:MAG TPA: FecR family protein [Candidatus Dormibacteraeota bacterium]|nr:FecR family protein [Candidatus Dormibacteraeota bacterium]
MAMEPPGAQPAPAAPPPPGKKSGCAGCSVSCLGCLGVIALVIILLLGGGYFFFVAQAQAGVASPAALLVATDPVEVGHNDSGYAPANSGQSLDAGSSVRTGHTGRATIQFPDGSLTRVAPDTTVTITSAQLNTAGSLKSATLAEKIGRTFSVVQKLTGGATFKVSGHSVSAEVRGTQFEVVVNSDFSNLFKVFDGSVVVAGQTTVTLRAGHQVTVDPDGRVGNPQSIRPDRNDPYQLEVQCADAVSRGPDAGTVQTTTGGPLSTGQSADVFYNSPGGSVSVALCWPGGQMAIALTDPNGSQHSSFGPSGSVLKAAGPAGRWTALVNAVNVPVPEPFAVAFSSDVGCAGQTFDDGATVRQVLSNNELAHSLGQSGITGITIQVQGTSSTSATIYYAYSGNGIDVSWMIDFYAATPNLGYVFTSVKVHGIDITTQFVSRLNAAGAAVTSIPQNYIVDRVYSCVGPDGDMMVIEGHH